MLYLGITSAKLEDEAIRENADLFSGWIGEPKAKLNEPWWHLLVCCKAKERINGV